MKTLVSTVSTEASYDLQDETITLNKISKNELFKAIKNPSNNNINIVKTYIHELSHWKDHQTTLWGIKNLINHYNALNSRLNNDPNYFYYIPIYIKDTKKALVNDYYKTNDDNFDVIKNRKYWHWRITIGKKFTHDGHLDKYNPILFIHFLNPINKKQLCRVPLGISSILETKAMAEEMLYYVNNVHLSTEELIVESNEFSKQSLKWLYNTQLSEYTANAHLISCLSTRGDIIETFTFSRSISILCLFMPDYYYDTLLINPIFENYKEEKDNLINNRDIGFLFINLILNYRDSEYDKSKYVVEDLLKASNLPKLAILEEKVIKEFEKLNKSIIDGPMVQIIRNKLRQAINNFKQNGFNIGSNDYSKEIDILSPRIVFKGDFVKDELMSKSEFLNSINELDDTKSISNDDWIYNLDELNQSLELFNDICGVY